MMIHLLKRALPFLFTLIVGTGLGNLIGWREPVNTSNSTCKYRVAQRGFRGGVGGGEDSRTQLKILFQSSPRFTPEALKNQTSGVVTLLVRFNDDGTTTVLDRLASLPDGLTEDAVRIAEQTRFASAIVNGKPITETRQMNYIYSSGNVKPRVPYDHSAPYEINEP